MITLFLYQCIYVYIYTSVSVPVYVCLLFVLSRARASVFCVCVCVCVWVLGCMYTGLLRTCCSMTTCVSNAVCQYLYFCTIKASRLAVLDTLPWACPTHLWLAKYPDEPQSKASSSTPRRSHSLNFLFFDFSILIWNKKMRHIQKSINKEWDTYKRV